jgi:hypothetical protein
LGGGAANGRPGQTVHPPGSPCWGGSDGCLRCRACCDCGCHFIQQRKSVSFFIMLLFRADKFSGQASTRMCHIDALHQPLIWTLSEERFLFTILLTLLLAHSKNLQIRVRLIPSGGQPNQDRCLFVCVCVGGGGGMWGEELSALIFGNRDEQRVDKFRSPLQPVHENQAELHSHSWLPSWLAKLQCMHYS